MDDLISRQKVLRLIKAMPSEDCGSTALLYQSVKQMDDGLVRCKDCKHYKPEVGSHEYALGYCPFIKSHLVMNKGFCAWAERQE